ncbi:MAG: hypothetical protein EAZ89_01610 [Bacteroidetes bacterium]|nr:MAG: hypothetical protein EAZ89_01610 [Bacteroidota bacterium]
MNLFSRKVLFLALLTVLFSVAQAQTPRFTKYPVMESGAAIYMPAAPLFEKSYSEDSSAVYTAEVQYENIVYGVITVSLFEDLGADTLVWDGLLMSYIEYLNSQVFSLTAVSDPGYGHKLESHPYARGVLQYGQNSEGNQSAVKGWVDGKTLAVLYVIYQGEMNINLQNIYLNGFRFPAK